MAAQTVRLPGDFHSSYAGRRAGRLGRDVFLFLLCRSAQVDGSLSTRDCAPDYLADMLGLDEEQASEGLQLAIAAGLVHIEGDRIALAVDGLWYQNQSRAVRTYAIEAEGRGLVKIGKSVDVARRLSELQTASPTPLRLIGHAPVDIEAELHRDLATFRRHGEWFELNDDVLLMLRLRGVV